MADDNGDNGNEDTTNNSITLVKCISMTLIILFLLFAYFMIGGYTPCVDRFYVDDNSRYLDRRHPYTCKCHVCYRNRNVDDEYNLNIYEKAPYMDIL